MQEGNTIAFHFQKCSLAAREDCGCRGQWEPGRCLLQESRAYLLAGRQAKCRKLETGNTQRCQSQKGNTELVNGLADGNSFVYQSSDLSPPSDCVNSPEAGIL